MTKKLAPNISKSGLEKNQVNNLQGLGADAVPLDHRPRNSAARHMDPKEKLLQEDQAILDEDVSDSVADRIILAQAEGPVSDAAPAGAGSVQTGSAASEAGGAASGAGAEGAAAGAAAVGAATGSGLLVAVVAGAAAAAAGGGGSGDGGSPAPTQGAGIIAVTDDVAPVSGTVASGGSTNDTTPGLTGTIGIALSGTQVVAIYRDGGYIGNATVTGTNWTFTDTGRADGTYVYTAKVESATGGNHTLVGTASGVYTVTVDTTAPAAPVISAVAGDNIINAGETGAAISGTAEANATVNLSLGGNVRTVTANGAGNWTYTLIGADITAMGQGAETLSATATDAAGNVSAAGTRAITVDTVVPAAPVISAVAGDNIINASETGAAISGTAEANATVNLSLGGNVRTVTANGAGSWTYTLVGADITAMGQGAETLSATATDAAGNVSAAGTRAITVDTVVPAAPAIGAVAGDNIINASETGAAISGTAEANATVNLSLGGNVRTVTANG
ncbi:MAG: Ig-like domain-containing protein, partial [Sulfuricella sp.]|nr:Ig-like domain-containing protein [Sulfuricella sp.]